MKKPFPLSKVHTLLQPGPVVMVSSAWKGRANIMTMSWHTMLDFDPPLVGCVISGENHSFKMIKGSRECVINIPTRELAAKAVACGSCSGAATDKFLKFGLTPQKGSSVKAPLIGECWASLECRLHDSGMAAKYDMLVMRVVKAWVDSAVREPRTLHHLGGSEFMVAGRRIKVPSGKP